MIFNNKAVLNDESRLMSVNNLVCSTNGNNTCALLVCGIVQFHFILRYTAVISKGLISMGVILAHDNR